MPSCSMQIMNLFLRLFAYRSATVHKEAMIALGALAYAIDPDFTKYMSEFYKFVDMGFQNYNEYQVCAVVVGVVGNLCRVFEGCPSVMYDPAPEGLI